MVSTEKRARWADQAAEQQSLLELEEKAVFALLEESIRVELLASNQRRSDAEIERLRARLRAIARERCRLEDEEATANLAEASVSVALRARSLDRQVDQLNHELRDFTHEDRCGRRRRSRDRLWVEALLLERERLAAERRRLGEQQAV